MRVARIQHVSKCDTDLPSAPESTWIVTVTVIVPMIGTRSTVVISCSESSQRLLNTPQGGQ